MFKHLFLTVFLMFPSHGGGHHPHPQPHPHPHPQPPPPYPVPNPNYGWSCSAQSETGQLFVSPVYVRVDQAQNAALQLCYNAGSQSCTIYRCVRK